MSERTEPVDLEVAHQGLIDAMRRRGRLLVAFSGGVDSGLVARLAHEALGEDALAVLADAESVPRRDRDQAIDVAREIGIPVRIVAVSELANPQYIANPRNRCYFCRSELGAVLRPLAESLGFSSVADGVNLSDLGDHRPGIRAMDEAGFWHPLVEFRLLKEDVRALARALGLSFHDKPSNACLASRIAYGEAISLEKLRRVEEAEEAIHSLGFRVVRVRSHDGVARIEIPREDLPHLVSPEVAARAIQAVRDAGFLHVTVDLRGYRSGSLNEAP